MGFNPLPERGIPWGPQLCMWSELHEVFHQYNEFHLYHSFMSHETDPQIKKIWERHLSMELEHLKQACEVLRRYEGIEPEEILPRPPPAPLRFEPNKAYIRHILATQVGLCTLGTECMPLERLPQNAPSFQSQRTVHGDGPVPSAQVIEDLIQAKGTEYRLETEGPHSVESLRQKR